MGFVGNCWFDEGMVTLLLVLVGDGEETGRHEEVRSTAFGLAAVASQLQVHVPLHSNQA
jgi:hypothetical protein